MWHSNYKYFNEINNEKGHLYYTSEHIAQFNYTSSYFCHIQDNDYTIYIQMEADANNKDKGTTKTELETVRSELLNVKQEMIKVEESLMTCQRNCGIKDQEAISLKRQLETLQTEQKSCQQLLQQVDEDKNNIESLTKQLLHKQKV